MFKNIFYGLMIAGSISFSTAYADNSPTLDQVYQAAHAGRLDEAQRMMDVVLKAHPNSAKAHFVEAELLAKQGQMGAANEELNQAQRLKPDLTFASPQAVQDLKNRIAASRRVSQSAGYQTPADQPQSGFPWGLLLLGVGAIAVIMMIMRAMNSRNAAAFPTNYQPQQPGMQNPNSGGMGGGGMGGGGMAPMGGGMGGGGMGSGIMGGLATGAAVGVGMVAGEALAHRFMDGGHSSAAPVADNSWGNNASDNMGGSDFGIANNSSWDDNSNVADSGSDGGDWG